MTLHTHDWRNDPMSCGAYSYAGVGGVAAPKRLAEPIADVLFMAGEHTYGGMLGTVAGAIQSGYRAGGQAIEKL